MYFIRKPVLNLIYEDNSQILENCFVSQLYKTLKRRFRIRKIPVARLVDGIPPFNSDDLVLSLLRQRNWQRMIPFLAKATEKSGAFYYDQDPWEAYFSQASSPGAYTQLVETCHVRAFLVTSRWWADYITKKDGLHVKFVRMGILPDFCSRGAAYESRPIEVGFQGTLHANRAAFFERMRAVGVDTAFRGSVPYRKFLRSIQDFRIFLHHELLPDGSPFNGLWIKEVEVASRGLFAIRNWDGDVASYALDELPTVFTFDDETEVPVIVDRIRSMPESERNSRIAHAVDRIRLRNDWNTVADAMLEQSASSRPLAGTEPSCP